MGAITTMYAAKQKAEAQKLQGQYTAAMSKVNADFTTMQADDAIRRGDEDAQAIYKKAKAVTGAQRVALATSGVDVNEGSAADVQAETAYLSELDAMKVKNNAFREAWGFKVEAQKNTFAGQRAAREGQNSARSTLTTGGIQAIGQAVETGTKYMLGGG